MGGSFSALPSILPSSLSSPTSPAKPRRHLKPNNTIKSLPPSRPNASRRGGFFNSFNATSTTSTSLASKREPEVDLLMFQRTGTITTFFASRREPEVDFSVVSTLLPPLPPPSRPNASRRWIFLAFRRHRLLQGVFFPRHQHRGGVKPIPFECFPCPLWLLGRRITLLPCLPPPITMRSGLLAASMTG